MADDLEDDEPKPKYPTAADALEAYAAGDRAALGEFLNGTPKDEKRFRMLRDGGWPTNRPN